MPLLGSLPTNDAGLLNTGQSHETAVTLILSVDKLFM